MQRLLCDVNRLEPCPSSHSSSACCVLRAENIFVCCCGVGSDRVAGVGVSLGALGLVRDDGRPCLGRCGHTTISRLRLSDRPLEFSAPARSCTVRAAVRRRAPGFFSGARLRAPTGAILDAHFAQTAGSRSPELSSGDCKGAGEPGILSPNPPTHGPRARAAELRGPARAHWVCHVPLFPSSTVSHPGDMRAGGTGSDQARSV